MRPSHLYFFDNCHYLGSGSLEAEDDFNAVRRVRDLGGNKPVERWHGGRKSGRFPVPAVNCSTRRGPERCAKKWEPVFRDKHRDNKVSRASGY